MFSVRDEYTFPDGSDGIEHSLCMVPAEQRCNRQFLVWYTIQGDVLTMGAFWFQYDNCRRRVYGAYRNINWAPLFFSDVQVSSRFRRTKSLIDATDFLQVSKIILLHSLVNELYTG